MARELPPLREERSVSGFKNKSLPLSAALQFQADIHKVIWRPWAGVFKVQTVAKLLSDFVYGSVKLRFTGLLNQERGVHDHLVAYGLIVTRGHTDGPQSVIDFTDVVCGQLGQGFINHAAKLHAR